MPPAPCNPFLQGSIPTISLPQAVANLLAASGTSSKRRRRMLLQSSSGTSSALADNTSDNASASDSGDDDGSGGDGGGSGWGSGAPSSSRAERLFGDSGVRFRGLWEGVVRPTEELLAVLRSVRGAGWPMQLPDVPSDGSSNDEDGDNHEPFMVGDGHEPFMDGDDHEPFMDAATSAQPDTHDDDNAVINANATIGDGSNDRGGREEDLEALEAAVDWQEAWYSAQAQGSRGDGGSLQLLHAASLPLPRSPIPLSALQGMTQARARARAGGRRALLQSADAPSCSTNFTQPSASSGIQSSAPPTTNCSNTTIDSDAVLLAYIMSAVATTNQAVASMQVSGASPAKLLAVALPHRNPLQLLRLPPLPPPLARHCTCMQRRINLLAYMKSALF